MPVSISNVGLRKIVTLVGDEFYPTGRKIEAIKRLRELTGLSLKYLRDLIEMDWEFRNPKNTDPVQAFINEHSYDLSSYQEGRI